MWGSITEETFIEAVESSQEVPEHSQFVQLMNHFQEQERERIQQFKFKSGLEVEQDITSALDKLQSKSDLIQSTLPGLTDQYQTMYLSMRNKLARRLSQPREGFAYAQLRL